MPGLHRAQILPEPELPDPTQLLAEGRRLARTVTVGPCPFLSAYGVRSESEYKRRRMAEGAIMLHAQFGYRSPAKSLRAYAEIYERVAAAGYRVDRYGICLDWSMGYPAAQRADMPRGTGLILEEPRDFAALTQSAPVAPHFGDFVIGTPAAVENTAAALAAGSTSIGNLGQYFTFRMPRWSDDVGTTAETIKALALCAAQPVEIMVHSNLDDGFAALFCDLACGLGAVLIERYIVEELIGGHVSHCYGHTFSEPLTRLAFQRALAQVTETPGSMVYGNTTIFCGSEVENYANLASYLLVDIIAQRTRPTGHGLNPVPVTEAMRIPEIDEIVDAHLFANRLIQRAGGLEALFDLEAAEVIADRLVEAGQRFKERVLSGLAKGGIDIANPFELLLAIRRIGAKRLEELFGPGEPREDVLRKRLPVVRATTVAALEDQGEGVVALLDPSDQAVIRRAGFTACVTCTDVHEYGKILVETALGRLDVEVIDAGVSADPDAVAERAKVAGADFIAVSTYNGVALDYLQALRQEIARVGLNVPIFIGGKLNQIPEDSPSSLPVDVSGQLQALGAVVCHRVEDMLEELLEMAKERNQ
ncbi:MAG: cobalamin-dependent protein [Anaerolineae bacterium]|nr:cobalamin-dependent protein [Anaerolineae bacterium]